MDVPAEIAQEGGEPRRIDVVVRPDREVEAHASAAGRHGQRADHRDLLPVASALSQDRRLAARGPSPAHERRQQNAALVEEDDVGVQALGFLLMRGQSTLIQRRITVSSRSRARRSGFCGLQPIARRRRPR